MLRRITLIAGMAALVAPATAVAAKPGARTGDAVAVTQATATLQGRVDANRLPTTYWFEIGNTPQFGGSTVATAAGARRRFVSVSAAVDLLAPATIYHYRLVAQNADGVTRGARRTFRTKNQPLGLTLSATPNPVSPPGGATRITGVLTGTNNAGRQVLLQSNPFPYTQGFATVGNALVTDAAGGFTFPILSLPVTTQFRVLMPQKPEVISPIVVVGAAVRVRTHTRKVEKRRHNATVRFSGAVLPPRDGMRVNIQKLRGGQWVTIAHTRAKDKSERKSTYALRVRIHRSGRFRVVAESEGDYVSGAGRTIRIKVPR